MPDCGRCKMLKAAIHNPYWDSMGGGERYVSAFIKLLLDKNYEVDIYFGTDLTSQIQERFDIDISGAKFVGGKIKHPYDLVFWVSDGSLPTLVGQKAIIHFQFPFVNVGGKSLKNLIKSKLYRHVANSQFTKKFVDEEFGINSTVIYPPIDTKAYSPGNKTDTILFVSRFSNLTQQKGHKILIETFLRLAPQVKNWKLILAGGVGVGTSDTNMAELENLIGGQPIEIITNPSHDQLKKLYSQAKIYCSPSGYGVDENSEPIRVEHFGITVVEAMASGCVPVIFNGGGHKEIVDNTIDGYLWNTLPELEAILLMLATNDAKLGSMTLAAREKSGMFDTANFNSQFDQLI